MDGKIRYDFSAKIWKHSSTGGWFFVSLPGDLSREIRKNLKWQEEGWLVQDEKKAYYIYAQTMEGRTQYGLVGAASV